MAAVSRSIGKRVSPRTHIWSWKSTPSASVALSSRNGHSSAPEDDPEDVAAVYEKNPDDPVPQNVVPDEMIQIQSEEYWVPHPQTGVFVPPSDCNSNEEAPRSEESVLEEEVWFRPTDIQDLEKPVSLQVEDSETSDTATR